MFLKVSGRTHYLSAQSIQQQIRQIVQKLHSSFENYHYFLNGKRVLSFENIQRHSTLYALVPLVGGKGGFGAKLKTEGGKKIRPNDNMFSRDVHGQRLVYSTMEKDYKEFVKKKIDEDQKVAREREQFKVMQNTLREGQSFMKLDRAYKKQIEETETKFSQSLLVGKQRLNERYNREQAQNERKDEENQQRKQLKSENECVQKAEYKQDEGQPKRRMPEQFKNDYVELTAKRLKVDTIKPNVLSAAQRFKQLFKK